MEMEQSDLEEEGALESRRLEGLGAVSPMNAPLGIKMAGVVTFCVNYGRVFF